MSFFNNSDSEQTTKPKALIYDIKINDIKGKPIDLQLFKGKKILFVNVASKCGFTRQYKGLQELYDKHKNKLEIIGVPCNQFGGQEPGTDSEIKQFCEANYGVTFLISEKLFVKGKNQHALYKWLTEKTLNGKSDSSVKWNFQKYLVDEQGKLVDYFYSATKPIGGKIEKLI
ncbi:MAG: glutathione peroxidase [Tenacibaculum sp.]